MKKIFLLLIIFAACRQRQTQETPTPTPQAIVYKDTVFTPSNSVTDKVFKNLRIATSQISGYGWRNVTFENCQIMNTPKGKVAVDLSSAIGITFRNNYFENNGRHLYINTGAQIVVENNNFKNGTGPNIPNTNTHYGQAVQLNNVTGRGNRIRLNYITNVSGQSDVEDVISVHNSRGDAAEWILVELNYINGGGPSASGGGIMLGDGANSSYQKAAGNVVINSGQYGVAIAGGSNMEISANKVYGKQQSFTNVGIYVSGYGQPCGSVTVKTNLVFWINSGGAANPFWFNSNCGNIAQSGNVGQSNLVSETMPPPEGCGVITTTPPPIPQPCPVCPPKAAKITVDKTTKIFDAKDSLLKSVTSSETISVP